MLLQTQPVMPPVVRVVPIQELVHVSPMAAFRKPDLLNMRVDSEALFPYMVIWATREIPG